MQFKLLNFHKLIGNFATSLVGTFIPLIILNQTGSLRLAILFLIGQGLCRILSNHIFKTFCSKYPQVALMIRVFPLLAYSFSLIFLDKFMVVGLIIIIISYGVNQSLKNNSAGVLLNYTSKKKTSRNLTVTRIVEALSSIIACISGGLFIDWNQTAVIIFSMSLYIISVLPLFIYFLVNKKKVGFNKDFISNAAVEYDKAPKFKQKRKNIVKYFVLNYFIFYALFCFNDYFTNLYAMHLFISAPTFATAGYLTAVFHIAYLFAVLLVEWLSKKIEFKTLNVVFAILCALPIGIIPFLQSYAAIYLLIGVFGFSYAVCSYFMMDSLLVKSKILGCANKALLARQDGIIAGQMIPLVFVLIFNSVLPAFFVMVAGLIIYAIYTFIVEEKLRKKLVDYLENNEIE